MIGEPEVGEEVFADKGMAAVVDLDRPLEVEGFSDAADEAADQLLAFRIIFIQGIVPAAGLVGLVLDLAQLFAAGIEHLSRKDFLFFCHCSNASVSFTLFGPMQQNCLLHVRGTVFCGFLPSGSP